MTIHRFGCPRPRGRAWSVTRRLAQSAVAVSVMGMALGVGSVASAAPIDIAGCVVDGDVVTVEVDDVTLADYEGGWYALHYAWAEPVNHAAPIGSVSLVPPICVVPVIDGQPDSSAATWAWCVEIFDDVCGEAPLVDQDYDTVLTADQTALVLWRLNEWQESGDTSTEAILQTQFNIWCITDDVKHVSTTSWGSAPAEVVECDEYSDWLDDQILPGLGTDDDYIDLVAPADVEAAGEIQVFELTTSLGSLAIDVSGVDSIDVCPGEVEAVLNGTMLTVSTADTPVRLCAVRGSTGSATVAVSPSLSSFVPHDAIGYSLPSCQVLFTHAIEHTQINRSAMASWVEAALPEPTDPGGPTDPDEPTEPVEPTDPADPADPAEPTNPQPGVSVSAEVPVSSVPAGTSGVETLPVTGIDSDPARVIAVSLLASGGVLVALAHRWQIAADRRKIRFRRGGMPGAR